MILHACLWDRVNNHRCADSLALIPAPDERERGWGERQCLVVAIHRRNTLVRRHQKAQRRRRDRGADKGHVAVHEQRVDAVAMEAERLIVDTAVIGRPGTRGGPAIEVWP